MGPLSLCGIGPEETNAMISCKDVFMSVELYTDKYRHKWCPSVDTDILQKTSEDPASMS